MADTAYRDGDVTVTLTGDLEGMIRRMVEQASGGAASVLEAAGDEVASNAAAQWYGPNGVTRETGLTGDVRRKTVISADEVRVRIFSADVRRAKNGKPVPVYVRRPGRLSTSVEEITPAEYYAAKRTAKGASLVFHAKRGKPDQGIEIGKYYRIVANPAASDGKYLVPLLITSPARAKVKQLLPQLGQIIAKRMGGG